ncbi:MAG: 50S ribosomal protein L6 [Deltaproteobacteria bacterium]|nr:MAG: 50S ribosomal protein L6 [Deltaproteobacteria bacterium]
MSRIGKMPISLPNGLEVSAKNGIIVFKTSKHERQLDTKERVIIKQEGDALVFSPKDDTKQSMAFWGTYRSLAQNIVIGLTKGYEKRLEVNGVGYRVAVNGNKLELNLGFSHPINFEIPKDIEISVEKNVIINIKGIDKQEVGQIAANIRSFRPPEPYKGKGIKYADEVIVRKAGKTAK